MLCAWTSLNSGLRRNDRDDGHAVETAEKTFPTTLQLNFLVILV